MTLLMNMESLRSSGKEIFPSVFIMGSLLYTKIQFKRLRINPKLLSTDVG